jgi:hypothetical protein
VAGAVVVALVAGVVGVRAATGGSVALPPVSPDRLAAETAAGLAADPTISGSVLIHFDLGIPNLGEPDLPGAGPLGLLLGDHTVRLWRSPFGARIALIEPTSERDLYLGRDGAWAWDFSSLTATRIAPPGVRTGLFPLDLLLGPENFRGILDGLRPTTAIAVGDGVRVAGRPAYPLTLVPRTQATLIGRVEVDVDAVRKVPLAVRVFPRGTGPAALDVAFTSVSFAPIDPHTFDFSPPPDSTVTRGAAAIGPLGLLGGVLGIGAAAGSLPGALEVRTLGEGWAGALAIRFRSEASPALDQLTRLLPLSGPLLSARAEVGSRFWIVVGPVSQDALGRLAEGL